MSVDLKLMPVRPAALLEKAQRKALLSRARTLVDRTPCGDARKRIHPAVEKVRLSAECSAVACSGGGFSFVIIAERHGKILRPVGYESTWPDRSDDGWVCPVCNAPAIINRRLPGIVLGSPAAMPAFGRIGGR